MWITRCCLTLHDSVFYATREMGTLYETERHLHNYALSYALFNDSLIRVPYFAGSCRPDYPGDMEKLNQIGLYVTPARPLKWDYLLATWKMAQVTYYRKPERFGARGNFPENFGRAKELAPGSTFEFFVIARQAVRFPRWIRLGKWASKALVEPAPPVNLTERVGSFMSAGPLNPLDLSGQLLVYDVVCMPPVSLVTNARIEGAYYELPGGLKLPAGMKYTFPDKLREECTT